MLRRYRYRLYPTEDQKTLIARHLGCCRFVYNWALARKNQAYHDEGISLTKYDLMKQLPALKEELPWLKEVNAQSLQQSIHHLFRAFTNFFEGRAEAPTFKAKHAPEQAFTVPQSSTVDFERGTVKLPKIGAVKTVFHRTFVGTMKAATVLRTSTGRYFLSIVVEDGRKPPKPVDPIPDQTVGIDLGLTHYAVLSTGEKVENPRYLRNAQTRLVALQRRLDRKKKGSKNRNKARLRVARCHQKIADQRRDFQHQLSSRLVRENQALAVESLNVDGMVKNHSLARSISDAGWGTFLSMLAYKCQEAGKTLLRVGVFEPSSKTCSVCGYRKADLTLKDREWTCPDCGTTHDRDLNAATNIKQFALARRRMSAEEPVDSLPGGRGMIAGKPPAQAGVVHMVSLINDSRGLGHAVCAEFLGGNMDEFSSWKFYQYANLDIKPGDEMHMPYGTKTEATKVKIYEITGIITCALPDYVPEEPKAVFLIDEYGTVTPEGKEEG